MDKEVIRKNKETPEFILIQPADEYDVRGFDSEYSYIADRTDRSFLLCAVPVGSWFSDLSPWDAPPVFGKDPFGHGAPRTLGYITDSLIPEIKRVHGCAGAKAVLGGYSLAGLFSLWGGYNYEGFYGIAAASPSVWFRGWDEYTDKNAFLPHRAYLSVGDKEEKTKNPVMASVGRALTAQYEKLLSSGVDVTLEYNEGNHFKDADIRTAKAFLNIMKK